MLGASKQASQPARLQDLWEERSLAELGDAQLDVIVPTSQERLSVATGVVPSHGRIDPARARQGQRSRSK